MNTDNNKLNDTAITTGSTEKLTYTVAEISQMLQIGMTKAYALCNQGLFRTIKIGKSLRISKQSFDEWLNNHMI